MVMEGRKVCAGYEDESPKHNHKFYCLNGENGSVLWSFALDPSPFPLEVFPVVGDIDQDGEKEICINDKNAIYCINGKDGSLLWE